MSHMNRPLVMLVPLALLGFGAVFAGLAFHGVFIGEEYGEFWKGALFTSHDNHILHEFTRCRHGYPIHPLL